MALTLQEPGCPGALKPPRIAIAFAPEKLSRRSCSSNMAQVLPLLYPFECIVEKIRHPLCIFRFFRHVEQAIPATAASSISPRAALAAPIV
jgi:hypothetical protein